MTCMVPTCSSPARSKGLCKDCHRVAARDVRSGKTTWEDLYALSLAVPAMRPRGPDHRFRVALREARERQREALQGVSEEVPSELLDLPARGRKRLAQRR